MNCNICLQINLKSHKRFNEQYKENKERKIKVPKYIQYVNSSQKNKTCSTRIKSVRLEVPGSVVGIIDFM